MGILEKNLHTQSVYWKKCALINFHEVVFFKKIIINKSQIDVVMWRTELKIGKFRTLEKPKLTSHD